MKLIPKAKPVKIRIKSGGEEHSSLDSLKRNFNISDIQPLLDGRLVRWLKQQGENELANVISEIDSASLNTLQGVMNVMQLFFKDYMEANGINNLLDLNKHWLNSAHYRKNGENLFFHITCNFWSTPESLEIIKYLYKHKEELKTPPCDWYKTFNLRVDEENESESDPEVLYILGKMLWEGYQFNDLYPSHHQEDSDGLELIEKAARMGYQEANLFVFEYNRNKTKRTPQTTSQTKTMPNTKRFDGVNKDRIRIWMRYNWEVWNVGALAFSKDEYTNDKEKSILEFLSTSHFLGYVAEQFGFERALQAAKTYFATKDIGILRNEKMFITGLLYLWIGYRAQAKDIFTEIKDYKLANYMLGNTRIIDRLDFKSMSFQNQLTFIKDHLFDYE